MKIIYTIENTMRYCITRNESHTELVKDERLVRHRLWMVKFFAVADLNVLMAVTKPSIDLP